MVEGNSLFGGFATVVIRHLLSYYYLYIVAFLLIQNFIIPVFFSPLSKYPGPFLAKFSPLWQLNVDRNKNRHLVYLAAHKKYGKVFRDGPNSLSFCDHTTMQRIYGTGKNAFPRSDTFQAPGIDHEHPPVFFAISAAAHARSRRMVSNAYSMSSILSMENQIDKLIMAFQRRLDEEVASGRWFDLSTWINFFTLDVISDLAHGDAFGFLETGQDVHGIMAALQGDSMFFAILGAFPWLAKLLFSSPMQKLVKLPDNDGLGFIMKMANSLIHHRTTHPSTKADLLNAFLASKSPSGEPISHSQVFGEVMATFVAGGDTTANSIAGIIGYLLRTPHALQKLLEEVDAADAQGGLAHPVPSFGECQKLPYLEAVISEALRLSPSVGGVFTRVVSTGGAEVLEGDVVPGGTVVGVNNYVQGRDPEVYGPDAEEFVPERWLDGASSNGAEDDEAEGGVHGANSGDKRKRFREADFAFGRGARVCIGRNLAYVELYKVIAWLVRRYDIVPRERGEGMWREQQRLFLYKSDFVVRVRGREGK